RLVVRPVQVLQRDQDRLLPRHLGDVAADGAVQPEPPGGEGVVGGGRGVGQQRRQERSVFTRLGGRRQRAQDLHPRPPGRGGAAVGAGSRGGEPAVRGQDLGEPAYQRGLTRARVAADQRHGEPGGSGRGGGQLAQLGLPADERLRIQRRRLGERVRRTR